MVPVLEAVPNFSEGRDLELIHALVDVLGRPGVEVVDWSADADHHRSVVTLMGDPAAVEAACVAGARFALERIDLREHEGVHPRVGALDVLPLVPVRGLTLEDARESARRVGEAVAELGVPVCWYGAAASAPRTLAQLRRGGFEAWREGRAPVRPDLPAGWGGGPHPSAGVACVGARHVLLAWNVFVEGVSAEELGRVAAELRERGPEGPADHAPRGARGRFAGLRTLALRLPGRGRLQLSMNLEAGGASPFDVYGEIEARVHRLGGRIEATEVIGLIPDPLVLPAATDRLHLLDLRSSRLLSARVMQHASERLSHALRGLLEAVEEAGDACPPGILAAAKRSADATRITPTPGDAQ